jgi:hypothetical protein
MKAAAWLSLALLAGCDSDPDLQPESDLSLRWKVGWDTTGVTTSADGWEVTNNRGVTFHVTRGYLVTYALQLRACETTTSTASLILNWFRPVPLAWAGHSGMGDQSFVYGEVEPLVPLTAGFERTVVLADEASYCSIHYLVARADTNLDTSAAEVPMDRVTLHLDGWWSAAGSETQQPLAIRTELNTGSYIDLERPISTPAGGDETVVVTRQLAAFFDDVDPAALSEARLAQSLLLNIAAAATVTQTGP